MTPEITLDKIMAHVVEDHGHLIWVGYASAGRFPQIRIGGKIKPVRRVLYEAVHGPLKAGLQVGVSCDRELCVHPDCLIARKKSTAQRGQKMTPERRMRIAASTRKKSKITMDVVREIRASDETGTAIEDRLGLSNGYVSLIRRNLRWVDHANPFSGLMA